MVNVSVFDALSFVAAVLLCMKRGRYLFTTSRRIYELIHLHSYSEFHSSHPTYTVQKLPGGENTKAFIGTAILIGGCAVPVFFKPTKTGHDLFSQEKPQAIIDSESKLRKDYMDSKKEGQQ